MKLGNNVLWEVIVLLVLAAFALYEYPLSRNEILGGWDMCLDYLAQGKLYGGQSFCSQAPLIFYIGLLTKTVLGSSLMWAGFAVMKAGLFALIFILLRKLTRGLGYGSDFLNGVLFLVLIYPNGANKPETLFSAASFLLGFYIQHLKRPKDWELYAGLSYALSLFFKYIAIYPIALSFLLNMRDMKSVRASIGSTVKLASPVLVGATAFYVMHPLLLEYTLIGHLAVNASVSDALYIEFFSWDVNRIALLVFVAAYAYLLLDKSMTAYERLFVLYPLVCLPLITFSLIRGFAEYKIPEYYALHVYPLLILSTQVLLKKKPAIFALVVGLVILYPSIDGRSLFASARNIYLSSEAEGLGNLVMSGFSVLPPSQRGLLFESSRDEVDYIGRYGADAYFGKIGWRVLGAQNRYLYQKSAGVFIEDPFWASQLRRRMNVTDNPAIKENLTGEEDEIKREILNGRYDVIAYTASSWMVTGKVLSEIQPTDLRGYCELYVPDFKYAGHGREHAVVIYTNRSICQPAAKKLARYYSDNLDMICNKSYVAAQTVKKIMLKDGYELLKNCSVSSGIREGYTASPRILDALITAFTVACTYLLARRYSQRKPTPAARRKLKR